jgi:hypothetical protein
MEGYYLLPEWLEPSIEKRIDELIVECITDKSDYSEFLKIINVIKKKCPVDVSVELIRLEDLYFDNDKIIGFSYRSGIKDILEVKKTLG